MLCKQYHVGEDGVKRFVKYLTQEQAREVAGLDNAWDKCETTGACYMAGSMEYECNLSDNEVARSMKYFNGEG